MYVYHNPYSQPDIFTAMFDADRLGINILYPSFSGTGAEGDFDVEVGEINLDKIQLELKYILQKTLIIKIYKTLNEKV